MKGFLDLRAGEREAADTAGARVSRIAVMGIVAAIAGVLALITIAVFSKSPSHQAEEAARRRVMTTKERPEYQPPPPEASSPQEQNTTTTTQASPAPQPAPTAAPSSAAPAVDEWAEWERKHQLDVRRAQMLAAEQARIAALSVGGSGAGQSAPAGGTPAQVVDRQRPAAPPPASTNATTTPAHISTGSPAIPPEGTGGVVLDAGTVIPAVLVSGIVSDLPGTIIAQTTRDVWGTRAIDQLAIPAGSRLVGTYSSEVAHGQERVMAVWHTLIRPDGHAVLLDAPAADIAGVTGLADEVDRHFFRLWSSALLISMLGVGVQQSMPQGQYSAMGAYQPTPEQEAAAAAMSSLHHTAGRVLERDLSIRPTITIRPGMEMSILVRQRVEVPHVR